MTRVRYEQLYDGDWLRPKHRGFREQCCNCGLVHVVDFRVVGGVVEFRARQDRRATAAVRRAPKYRRFRGVGS